MSTAYPKPVRFHARDADYIDDLTVVLRSTGYVDVHAEVHGRYEEHRRHAKWNRPELDTFAAFATRTLRQLYGDHTYTADFVASAFENDDTDDETQDSEPEQGTLV
ncbi:MAG: hypothetical protein ABEN55_00440 [Bradymonadaceae bacterium]